MASTVEWPTNRKLACVAVEYFRSFPAGRGESASHRPSPLPSFRIEPASPPLVTRSRYFSISEDQLRMTDKGAELDVSTLVLTRNFCPSDVTS